MNLISELRYFISPLKNEELIRKLLRKNPCWQRGHSLLADLTSDQKTKEVSLRAAEILKNQS